jgi:uncharacterized protein with GYD domain
VLVRNDRLAPFDGLRPAFPVDKRSLSATRDWPWPWTSGGAGDFGREETMGVCMIQARYTPQAWAAMVSKAEHREQVFRSLCEQAGAKYVGSYYCFGEYDVIAFYDAPDARTAAAVSVAVTAAGHLRSAMTTPLQTDAEGFEVMKKAGSLKVPPPTGR